MLVSAMSAVGFAALVLLMFLVWFGRRERPDQRRDWPETVEKPDDIDVPR